MKPRLDAEASSNLKPQADCHIFFAAVPQFQSTEFERCTAEPSQDSDVPPSELVMHVALVSHGPARIVWESRVEGLGEVLPLITSRKPDVLMLT